MFLVIYFWKEKIKQRYQPCDYGRKSCRLVQGRKGISLIYHQIFKITFMLSTVLPPILSACGGIRKWNLCRIICN